MPNEVSSGDYNSVVRAEHRFGRSNPPGPPLQPPGGGGTFDGMEARVARLEADVGHIQKDVSEIKDVMKDVRTDLSALQILFAETKTHVSYLPSKTFIGTVVTGGIAFLITALTLLSHFGFLVAGTPK